VRLAFGVRGGEQQRRLHRDEALGFCAVEAHPCAQVLPGSSRRARGRDIGGERVHHRLLPLDGRTQLVIAGMSRSDEQREQQRNQSGIPYFLSL